MQVAPASPADPRDRFEVVPDPDAEPLDVDRFLDALDRIVERRVHKSQEESEP